MPALSKHQQEELPCGREEPGQLSSPQWKEYLTQRSWCGQANPVSFWADQGFALSHPLLFPLSHIHGHLEPHSQHSWLQQDNLGDSTGKKTQQIWILKTH